jgi:hypothetical protein
MVVRGLILSLARDGRLRLSAALRGVVGVRIEDTRHGGLVVIRGGESTLIGLLESWRIGVLPMYPILLARPFNHVVNLDGTYVYDIRSPILHYVPRLILGSGGEPRLRRVRVRVRGHGLGVGDTLREAVLQVLNQHSILPSRRSSIILSVEVIRLWSGGIRVYTALYPKHYHVKYHGAEALI